MKQRFVSLGVGLLILAAVLGLTIAGQFSPAITLILSDARLFYALGAILIFGGEFLLGAKGHFGIWDAVLLYLPLAGAFALTTLRELPFMWPTLPLWILSGVIGARLAFPSSKPAALADRRERPASGRIAMVLWPSISRNAWKR